MSSATLKATSPVFAVLLGPRFAEGQHQGRTKQPKVIAPPEDEPQAMSDVCCLLHGKSVNGFLQRVDGSRLLDQGIGTDKYSYFSALRLLVQGIFFPHLDYINDQSDIYIRYLGKLHAAAYLLEHARAFEISSSSRSYRSNGDVASLPREKEGKFIPGVVLRTYFFLNCHERALESHCRRGWG